MEELRTRRLVRVLADWNAPTTPVHLVYPSTRHLSPKVKTFVDHLHDRMTPPQDGDETTVSSTHGSLP